MAIVLPMLAYYHCQCEVDSDIDEAQPVHSTQAPLWIREQKVFYDRAGRTILLPASPAGRSSHGLSLDTASMML
jgi:hypothetical protein